MAFLAALISSSSSESSSSVSLLMATLGLSSWSYSALIYFASRKSISIAVACLCNARYSCICLRAFFSSTELSRKRSLFYFFCIASYRALFSACFGLFQGDCLDGSTPAGDTVLLLTKAVLAGLADNCFWFVSSSSLLKL